MKGKTLEDDQTNPRGDRAERGCARCFDGDADDRPGARERCASVAARCKCGSLNAIDNALTTLNGGLLGSLLNPVSSLLLALNPAAASNLNAVVADLQQIGSAPGASVAVEQAVSELTAAMRTAALGQLLTQVSGVSSAQNASALTALAGLQSIPLGGSAPGGRWPRSERCSRRSPVRAACLPLPRAR